MLKLLYFISMRLKRSSYSIIGLLCVTYFFSCSNPAETPTKESEDIVAETVDNTNNPPLFNTQSLELKTYEVTDETTGKIKGWGYDIYVDGKRNIHQPIIPGIAGNNSFASEEDAKKTGNFAIKKMKQSGGLPTISLTELDSLGITKN